MIKSFTRWVGASLVAFSALMPTANAGIWTQDIFLSVEDAVAGNAYGYEVGDSELIGSLWWESDTLDGFGTPADDGYGFSLNLGGVLFSEADDPEFPFAPFFVEDNAAIALDILALNGAFEVEMFELGMDILLGAYDDIGYAFGGLVELGDAYTASVPVPATLGLILLSFVLLRRRTTC